MREDYTTKCIFSLCVFALVYMCMYSFTYIHMYIAIPLCVHRTCSYFPILTVLCSVILLCQHICWIKTSVYASMVKNICVCIYVCVSVCVYIFTWTVFFLYLEKVIKYYRNYLLGKLIHIQYLNDFHIHVSFFLYSSVPLLY